MRYRVVNICRDDAFYKYKDFRKMIKGCLVESNDMRQRSGNPGMVGELTLLENIRGTEYHPDITRAGEKFYFRSINLRKIGQRG